MPASPLEGTIVAGFGRHYEIELADGSLITGYPLGKKSPYACGDKVLLERSSANQAQIIRNLPRTSLLYRSDAFRQKLIVANATQLVLVVATEPSFSDELLTRALIAAETEGIRSLIVLNKIDLPDHLNEARDRLAPLAALGYPILELTALQSAAALREHLADQLSVLVGQSGMGKSTLINALIPGAAAATREVSTALDSGKHTTTHTRLYHLTPPESASATASDLIDSPGLQEFGLAHLTRGTIEQGFREFRPHLACRFRDCHHHNEPGCAIKDAVEAGLIDRRRYELFLRIGKAQC